jgi:hypothetical protein
LVEDEKKSGPRYRPRTAETERLPATAGGDEEPQVKLVVCDGSLERFQHASP